MKKILVILMSITLWTVIMNLSFLDDECDNDVWSNIAQFASPNKWFGITTPKGTVNFDVMYDSYNRNTSRNSNIALGDGATIQPSEAFSFVN